MRSWCQRSSVAGRTTKPCQAGGSRTSPASTPGLPSQPMAGSLGVAARRLVPQHEQLRVFLVAERRVSSANHPITWQNQQIEQS
jgi:hypothetical protein